MTRIIRPRGLMETLLLPFSPRFIILTICGVVTALLLAIGLLDHNPKIWEVVLIPIVVFGPLTLHVLRDLTQKSNAVLRNYPISAHIRFLLEEIRPEMRQYFFESEKDGMPFSRDTRALVYQRAKMVLDKRPFGTQEDVYRDGYEWMHHSVAPKARAVEQFRVTIGAAVWTTLFSASEFNILAERFWAVSPNARRELNSCAQKGGDTHSGCKLRIGHAWELLAICKAMLQPGIYPDFMVVDGNEGGTGAAPLEFMDHLGMPMREGVNFVHNALIGINARDRIRIGAAGKIATAFDMARAMAIGADWCNSARGFMFSLGCIQSLSCHTDRCPTGVTTQDPTRARALVVPHKIERVYNYHHATLHALAELLAAAGLEHPQELRPIHFSKRSSTTDVQSFAKLYPSLRPGELIDGTSDPRFREAWAMARADSFAPAGLGSPLPPRPCEAGTQP